MVDMPWDVRDAREKNRRAVGELGRLWVEVANRELRRHGDEGRAIRVANGVLKRVIGGGGGVRKVEKGRKEKEVGR